MLTWLHSEVREADATWLGCGMGSMLCTHGKAGNMCAKLLGDLEISDPDTDAIITPIDACLVCSFMDMHGRSGVLTGLLFHIRLLPAALLSALHAEMRASHTARAKSLQQQLQQ